MAKTDNTKYLKPFPKGTSGNPKGRPPKLLTEISRELLEQGYKRLTHANIAEAFELLFNLPEVKVKQIAESTKSPMILKIVAKKMIGRHAGTMVELMLDRVHGKSKANVDVTSNGETITANVMWIGGTNEQPK